MIKRIWDRISDAIPTEQAAYQPGRGTTEHVFAVKMIAEKAITSNDYTAFLLLLDMSKAFDTVDRELLFNHLEKILEPDELHIMSRLTNHPQIKVRVGTEHAQQFESTIGRKMIALEHMKTFKNIFNSHKLKTVTKVRTFNTYVATIFLYNSETWTITQTLENQIDSCHRRLLREAIGVHYPKIIIATKKYIGSQKQNHGPE